MHIVAVEITDQYHKFRVIDNNSVELTYMQIFKLSKCDEFCNNFINIFENIYFDFYFFEVKPIKYHCIHNESFEFVVSYPSVPFLGSADYSCFKEYGIVKNDNSIIHFHNKSGDCLLICPTYNCNYEKKNYAHIGLFMKSKNNEQKIQLIQTMLITYYNQLKETPNKFKWLSTHGLGVPWLHVRIDNSPKYIAFEEYR